MRDKSWQHQKYRILCECGNAWNEILVEVDERRDKKVTQLFIRCPKCGKRTKIIKNNYVN